MPGTPGGNAVEASARNQLRGTLKAVHPGRMVTELLIDVGGQEIVSSIPAAAYARLSLKVGDPVTVILKATEVMVNPGPSP
jgi:molybdopterin-binding protein